MGLAAVNDPSKIWLMLFTLVYHINQEFTVFISLYQLVVGLLICYQIHQNLIFDNKDANLKYFIGFACIAGFNVFNVLEIQLLEGDN